MRYYMYGWMTNYCLYSLSSSIASLLYNRKQLRFIMVTIDIRVCSTCIHLMRKKKPEKTSSLSIKLGWISNSNCFRFRIVAYNVVWWAPDQLSAHENHNSPHIPRVIVLVQIKPFLSFEKYAHLNDVVMHTM